MKIYMAPMEGITTYIFRNAYEKYFGGIDRYFTPFIVNKKMSSREMRDILPENNPEGKVIPQIMTNQASDFLKTAGEIASYGYETVNLNLGCPSGTVAAKGRGAGFLAYPEKLDVFLSRIYEESPVKVSIKTRIGIGDAKEWEQLLAIYEKYPMEELILHPRLQKDFYKHPIRMEAYLEAEERIRAPLCYNGDIDTAEKYRITAEQFQKTDCVMIGRGILKNPGLVMEILQNSEKKTENMQHTDSPVQLPENTICRNQPSAAHRAKNGDASGGDQTICQGRINREVLRSFHDEICDGYRSIMSGDRNTLYKMKELWSYLGQSFKDSEKYMKKIKKTERLAEYEAIVAALFREKELII